MDSHESRWAMDNALHRFSAPVSEVQTPDLSGHTFGMQHFPAASAPHEALPPPSCQSSMLHSEGDTDNFQKHPARSSSSSLYSDITINTPPTEFNWENEVVEPVSSNLLNLESVDADRVQESLPLHQERRQLDSEAFEEDMSWTSDILSTDSQMNLDDPSFETHNELMGEQKEASLADELLFFDPTTEAGTEPRSTQNSSSISQQISPLPPFVSPPADDSEGAWQGADKTDLQLATYHKDSFDLGCSSLDGDQITLSRVKQQAPGSLSEQLSTGSLTRPSQEPNKTTGIDTPEDPNMQDAEDVHMDDLSVPQEPSETDPRNIQSLGLTKDLSLHTESDNEYKHHTGKGNPIPCTSNRVTETFSDVQNVMERHSGQVINTHGMIDEAKSPVDKDQSSLQDKSVLECDQTEKDQTEMIISVTECVRSQPNPDTENEQDVDARLAPQSSLLITTQPAQIDGDNSEEPTSPPSSVGSIMFLSDIDDQEATDEEQDVENKGDTENSNDNLCSVVSKATEPDSTTCIGDEPLNEDPDDDRRCESRLSGDLPGDDKSPHGVDDVRKHTENEEPPEAFTETESGQNLQSDQCSESDRIQLENNMQCRENTDKNLSDTSEGIQNNSGSVLNVDKENTKDKEGTDKRSLDQSVQKVPEVQKAGQESLDNSTEVCDLISDDDKEGYKDSTSGEDTVHGQQRSKQCESWNSSDQSPKKLEGDAAILKQDGGNIGKHNKKENVEDEIQDKDSVAKDQETDNIIQDSERSVDEHSDTENKDQDDVAKPQAGDSFAKHSESYGDGNLAKDTVTDVDKSQEPICLSDSDEERRSGSVSLQNKNQSVDSAPQSSKDNQEKKESDSTIPGSKEDEQEESDDDVLVVEDDSPEVISVDDSSDEDDDASTDQTTGPKNKKASNGGKKTLAKSNWLCQICGNSNKSLNSLKLHVRRSHNLIMVHRKEEMKCKMCSFTGTWQKIKEHIIKDHQTPLKWYVKNQGTTEITKLPAPDSELPEDSLLAQPILTDPKASKELSPSDSSTANTSSTGSNKQIYLIKKVSAIEVEKQKNQMSGPGRPPLANPQSNPNTVIQAITLKSTANSVLSRPSKNYQQIAPQRQSLLNTPSRPIRESTVCSKVESTSVISLLKRQGTQNNQPKPTSLPPGTVIHDSSSQVMTILTARPDTNLHDKRRAVINRELSAKVREVFQQQSVGGPPLVTKISGTTYVISTTSTNALRGTKASPVVPKATPVAPKALPVAPTALPVVPTALPVAPTALPVAPTALPVAPTAPPVAPKAPPLTSLSLQSCNQVLLVKNTAPKLQEAVKPATPQQGQTAFVVRNVSAKTPNVVSVTPSPQSTTAAVQLVLPQIKASNASLGAATLSDVSPAPVPVVPPLFNHEYCKRTIAPVLNTQQWDTIKTTTAPRLGPTPQLASIGPHTVHADNQAQISRATAGSIITTQTSVPITLKTSSSQSNSSTPAGTPMASYVIKVPKAQSNGSSKGDEDGPSYLVKVPVNQTSISKKFMVHLPFDKKSKVKHAVCIVQPPLQTTDSGSNLSVVGKLLQSTPKADTPSLVTDTSKDKESINNRISALATTPSFQSVESRTLVNTPLSCFVEPIIKAQDTVPVLAPMSESVRMVGEPSSRVSFLSHLKEPALDIQLLRSQFENTQTFKAADFIKIDERVQYECARCKESFPQLMLLQLHHIDCTTHPPAGTILPIVHIPTAMLASFFTVSPSGYSSACAVCSILLLGNARNVEDQQDFSSHLSKHTEPTVAITCLDDTRKLGILQTRTTSQQAKEWVDFIAPPFRMGNKPTSTQEGNLEEFINTTGILHQESMLLRRRSRRHLTPEHDKRQSKHKHKKHKHKHRHSRDHELLSKEAESTPYKSSVKTLEGCEGEWIEPSPKGSSTLRVRKKCRPGALKQSITSSPSQPKPQLHTLTPVKKKNLTPSKVRQRFLNVSVPGRRSLRGMGLDFGLGLMMLPLGRKKRKEKSPMAKSKSSSHSQDLNKDDVIEIFSSDEDLADGLPFEKQRERGNASSTQASPVKREEPDDLETKNLEGNPGELSASNDGDVDSEKEKMNVEGSDSKDANYSDNMGGEDSSSNDEENADENRSNADNSERELESDGEATNATDLPLTLIALHYQRVNKDIAKSEMEDDNMDCQPSTSRPNPSDGHETQTIISEKVDNNILEVTSSSQPMSPCQPEEDPHLSLQNPTCTSGRSTCSSSMNDDILLDSDEEGKMLSSESQVAQTEQSLDIPPLRAREIHVSGETESKSPSAENADVNFDLNSDLGEREDKQGQKANIFEHKILGEGEDLTLEDAAQHGRSPQDSFPTSRSCDDVTQDEITPENENSQEDHSTRQDSSSAESFPTEQSWSGTSKQEGSSSKTFQGVIEDTFPSNTSLEDDIGLDGSISQSSLIEVNKDGSSKEELSKNISQGNDFPQQDNSCEQEKDSKGSFPSSRPLEDVPVEDASTNSLQGDSNSVDSFPTNKSPEGDFFPEDTIPNSFQQITNFLNSSQENISQDERGSRESSIDGTNHGDDILDLNISGDEITGDWIIADSVSSSSNPDENDSLTKSSEAAAKSSPLPDESISDDSVVEVWTEDGTCRPQPDVETNKSTTQSLIAKENIRSDKAVQDIPKASQNQSPLAESNLDHHNHIRHLSDDQNVQDIFLDNESKSSFGDGFDVEDWEEDEELHLPNNHEDDAAILEDDPVEVEEASLSASESRSRLTGDKLLDDSTPRSKAIHSYLKTPQSVLHSEEEVGETEESQASQFNNLKRKSGSLREGDATSKKSRLEGVSRTDV